MFRVSRPMLVVVLKAWVTEMKETPCVSNSSTNLAKSASDRGASPPTPAWSRTSTLVSPLEAKLIRVEAGKSRDQSVEGFAR